MIPRATSRPAPANDVGVKRIHRQTALSALVLTRGGGMVVVKRRGARPGRTAARVAKAWNLMLDDAERRHEAFWRAYDAAGEREAA
jgi:hypothetical protein